MQKSNLIQLKAGWMSWVTEKAAPKEFLSHWALEKWGTVERHS